MELKEQLKELLYSHGEIAVNNALSEINEEEEDNDSPGDTGGSNSCVAPQVWDKFLKKCVNDPGR